VIRAFNTMQAQIQKFVAQRTMMLAASRTIAYAVDARAFTWRIDRRRDSAGETVPGCHEMQTMVDGALAFFVVMRTRKRRQASISRVLQTIANDYAIRALKFFTSGLPCSLLWPAIRL